MYIFQLFEKELITPYDILDKLNREMATFRSGLILINYESTKWNYYEFENNMQKCGLMANILMDGLYKSWFINLFT